MKPETRKVVVVILISLAIILLLFNIFNHRYTRSYTMLNDCPHLNVSVLSDLDSIMDNASLNDSTIRDSILSIITAFNQNIIKVDSLISVENSIQRRIEQNNDAFLDKVNIWVTFWVSFITFFLTIIPILLNIRIERNFSREFDNNKQELEVYKKDVLDRYKDEFNNYEKKFDDLDEKNGKGLEEIQKGIEESERKINDKIEEINIKKESLNILYCYNMIDTIGSKLDYYNSDDRRAYVESMLKDAIKSTLYLQKYWNKQKSEGRFLIEERLTVKRTLVLAISKVLIFMEGNKIKKPRILYEQMENLKAIRYANLSEIESDNERFAKVLNELRVYYRIDS